MAPSILHHRLHPSLLMPQRWPRFLGTYSMVSKAKGMGMRLSIIVALSSFIIACAQQPPTPPHPITCPGVTSPDQQLRACVLSVGRHPNPHSTNPVSRFVT